MMKRMAGDKSYLLYWIFIDNKRKCQLGTIQSDKRYILTTIETTRLITNKDRSQRIWKIDKMGAVSCKVHAQDLA